MNVSILELAARDDAFACIDYEPPSEEAEDFLVSSSDHLDVVCEKARKLADLVLQGRSIAAALGETDTSAEEIAISRFNEVQKRLFSLWKAGCPMPSDMQWSSLRAVELEADSRGRPAHEEDSPTSKRLRLSQENQAAQSVAHTEKVALADLFRLSSAEKVKVTPDDVLYFRTSYPSLAVLLDAMHDVVRMRSGVDGPREELLNQRRERECEATCRAIDAIEKQHRFIKAEADAIFAQVERYVSIVRERVRSTDRKLGGQGEFTSQASCSNVVKSATPGESDCVKSLAADEELEQAATENVASDGASISQSASAHGITNEDTTVIVPEKSRLSEDSARTRSAPKTATSTLADNAVPLPHDNGRNDRDASDTYAEAQTESHVRSEDTSNHIGGTNRVPDTNVQVPEGAKSVPPEQAMDLRASVSDHHEASEVRMNVNTVMPTAVDEGMLADKMQQEFLLEFLEEQSIRLPSQAPINAKAIMPPPLMPASRQNLSSDPQDTSRTAQPTAIDPLPVSPVQKALIRPLRLDDLLKQSWSRTRNGEGDGSHSGGVQLDVNAGQPESQPFLSHTPTSLFQ